MASNKYNPGGGLNYFWVEEEIERIRKEKMREEMEDCGESIESIMEDFASNLLKSMAKVPVCNNDGNINNELEAKFQFIKNHSDNPEDLELAKKIIGID